MPYGSWPTPITSDVVVEAAVQLGEVAYADGSVTWSEQRPQEGGRTQIVRWLPDWSVVDLLPDGFNARTAAHEYGGGAWWVRGQDLWFANWDDQRLYQLMGRSMPVPITPEPAQERGERWADGDLDGSGRWLAVVRELHEPGATPAEVVNEILVLDVTAEHEPRVMVSGPDFLSDPRFSDDGRYLCWLQWNHPDMPWDGTELCVAELSYNTAGPEVADTQVVAGRFHFGGGSSGDGESVSQPRWSDGLWFISDRTGWWSLYHWSPGGRVEPMVEIGADIGVPQWIFGLSRYDLLGDGSVVFAYLRDGLDHLAVRDTAGVIHDLDLPFTVFSAIQADGDRVVLVAGSADSEPAVVRLRLGAPEGRWTVLESDVLRPPRDLGIDPTWFSRPEPISFPTAGETAHALFYPPRNPEVDGPADELPPLLVVIHGGPTSAARPELRLGTQYWTSRGFAVVDVNHRGSTGYGREYREKLRDAWGIVDVEDSIAAARWLVEKGPVDPDRLCIAGGSAGGYTTLAALALSDVFAAGANYFGVADLEALAAETHKFESHYLDGLIGPYPERSDIYRERSPINHLDGFEEPLVVFQGLDDPVVPPSQSEMIVDALRKKGVPVSYLAFEGEQHGFRQAKNIRRALDGELSFYSQIFGFDLPGGEAIEPIEVENL